MIDSFGGARPSLAQPVENIAPVQQIVLSALPEWPPNYFQNWFQIHAKTASLLRFHFDSMFAPSGLPLGSIFGPLGELLRRPCSRSCSASLFGSLLASFGSPWGFWGSLLAPVLVSFSAHVWLSARFSVHSRKNIFFRLNVGLARRAKNQRIN